MVKGTFAGNEWNQKDYESYMNKSIEKLQLLKRDSVKIDPGDYRTYIAPAGVSDILDMFSWNCIGEASIRQGQSALIKLRENKKLSNCFSLEEDFSSGFVPRFNSMGEIAPEVLNIIDNGMLRNTLISSRTAKEYNLNSNFASDGEYLRSPKMNSGDLKENNILSQLGTGLYLSNLHYLNWSDNLGGRITGMTRYACFWVENGEFVAPIENMRFDDSIYNFFGENLEAVSQNLEYIPSVGSYEQRSIGGSMCPGILLDSFKLTL
jgi:predicted Zn-dependent protease